MSTRLSLATLDRLSPGVSGPRYDRSAVGVGVVHFGPGAFHRAHQAWYLDELLVRDSSWGVCAVSLRSPGVRDALEPQDGLYVLASLDRETTFRVIGSLVELLVAPENPDAVLARLASPKVRAVTMTVTEKGYCLTPEGDLDLSHPDIVHDQAHPGTPVSLIGYLVEGLRRRQAAGGSGLDLISCDNLADNGARLRRAVLTLASLRDDALARWIENHCHFPRTMVDSITPATDDAVRDRVHEAVGLDDAWPIQREAFTQWVIEDIVSLEGPDWASTGAVLASDVGAFERAKLRLLNGAHSTLAYVGLLRGRETVGDAMSDDALARFVEALMREDIAPTVQAPAGLDLPGYIDAVLERFRNPAIRHNLSQIAWDGSQKLPFRILATISDALASDRSINRLATPLAAWMRFIRQRTAEGVKLVDPLADRLIQAARECTGEAVADVSRFLEITEVFPSALATDPRLRRAVAEAYAQLPDLELGQS